MIKQPWLMALGLALLSSPAHAAPPKMCSSILPKVIYGEDGRHDLYQTQDPRVRALASSTVALMSASGLRDQGNGSSAIQAKSFGDSMTLCADEPFREQPSAAFCSGSLIAPNLVLTAGHCIRSQADCNDARFVFGFAITQDNVFPTAIENSQIYSCAQVIHSQVSAADFAIIKLDRSVSDHDPLALGFDSQLQVGTSLTVIGHPSGIPTKIEDSGRVRNLSTTGYFQGALDTYGGNSGSGVFDSETGKIVGVLVRGERDFVRKGSCYVSNRCTESGCRGEDVTRIDEVRTVLAQ